MSVEEGAPPTRGYLHACQRAELLGLPTPSEAEWLESDEYAQERDALEKEEHDAAVAKELKSTDESMKGISGGLDELNVILNATQKKINKFKNVCGSLGTLLKARVSSHPGTPEHKSQAGSSSEGQSSMSVEEAEAPHDKPQAPNDGADAD